MGETGKIAITATAATAGVLLFSYSFFESAPEGATLEQDNFVKRFILINILDHTFLCPGGFLLRILVEPSRTT